MRRKQKLHYKEAFFKIADRILERADNEDWDGVVKEIFDILEELDDQKGAIEFVSVGTADQPEVTGRTIDFLRRRALKLFQPVEKPEESEISEIGHGEEGIT